MSEEIEPADKTQYLEAFADLRPDLFFPQDWTPEQKGRATEEMSSRKTRTAMYSSIPMQCDGPACPYAAVCPLLADNNAPIGHKCPIEMGIVIEFGNNLMREFGVDPTNLVEVSMVRDLVDFEVQYMRAMKILAQEHFISEVPVGVDANGEVIVGKQLHQAVEYEEKILKRKERLLNAFLATREARTKAGQGQLDASVQVANLLDTVREHKARADRIALEKLGVPTKDAYIEADAAAREETGEESDE